VLATAAVAITVALAAASASATVTITSPGVMQVDLPATLQAGSTFSVSDSTPLTIHGGEMDLQLQSATNWTTVASGYIASRAFRMSWLVPAVAGPASLRYLLARDGRTLAISQTTEVLIEAPVITPLPARVLNPTLLPALLALTSPSATLANASHGRWPDMDTLWIGPDTGATLIGTLGNDELLGGPGSDTLIGGPGNDVLWGDQLPSPNGPDQHDVIYGGSGNDFIYTSHGTNTVYAGPGNDTITATFGTGTIDCGSGYDTVRVAHGNHYKLISCEVITVV